MPTIIISHMHLPVYPRQAHASVHNSTYWILSSHLIFDQVNMTGQWGVVFIDCIGSDFYYAIVLFVYISHWQPITDFDFFHKYAN